jgi:uncharacterized membrane protein (DUF485 family)
MSRNKKTDEIMAVPEKDKKTFRMGLKLFTIYIVGYFLFTIAGTINKNILMTRVLGMNVGIVGGMIIIISAILIAVYYNWYAGQVETGAK